MGEAKPTPGPLRIQADDKWPFYIRTIDAAGDCVFREDMPAYSTAQRSLAECLAGKRMSGDQDRAVCANAVALANAELRAEAHNVLTTTGLTPSQLVERVKELEETLQAVKHNQSASVAPIAYVDGDDAMRGILWEPTQAAFDIPVGTKLYTQPTPADADDAARYRWLRRWKGQEHEPPFTVQHEIDGTLWGGDLDAAIDAALSKARPNTAEGE